MNAILVATILVGVIGFIIGCALVATGKKFHVETDPREEAVRACLAGNNCGACGMAGCDAAAAAIVTGEAPVNVCPVTAAPMIEKIGEIMGVSAVAGARNVAYVKCAGTCDKTSQKVEYVGIQDCRAVALSGLNIWNCDFGCLGFGSCVKACTNDAIHVVNGVAVVDKDKCVGCGLCAKACPKKLIDLIPETQKLAVGCSNHDKGPAVKKACTAGCIGCGLCVKQCEHDAIKVDGNVAHIDAEKCVGCGKCAAKCPTKAIKDL